MLNNDADINELVKSHDFDPSQLDIDSKMKILGIDTSSDAYKSDIEMLTLVTSLKSDLKALSIAQEANVNIPQTVQDYADVQKLVDQKFKRIEELVNKDSLSDTDSEVTDSDGIIMTKEEADVFNIISSFKK